MPAPTLQSMAIRACVRNIASITDVADIPYEIIKPVLRRIQNPDQLRQIEENSPHIADVDEELWRAFIARDIPNWEDKIMEPSNPRSWWKVYRKLLKEYKRAEIVREQELERAMSGLSKQREENQTAFVDRVVPQKAKEKTFIDGVRNPHVNSWGSSRTPALKNAKRGKDVINAIRAQSRQAAKDRRLDLGLARKGGFSVGVKPLPSAAQQISHAPQWMVREQSKPALMAPAAPLAPRPPPAVFAPKRGPSATERMLGNAEREKKLRALAQSKEPLPPAQQTRGSETIAEREARLRALTGSKASSPPANSPPPMPRAVQRTASPAISGSHRTMLSGTGSPVQRPSPAPEMARKRPAAVSSPFLPAAKKKRL
jgi:elongin-A